MFDVGGIESYQVSARSERETILCKQIGRALGEGGGKKERYLYTTQEADREMDDNNGRRSRKKKRTRENDDDGDNASGASSGGTSSQDEHQKSRTATRRRKYGDLVIRAKSPSFLYHQVEKLVASEHLNSFKPRMFLGRLTSRCDSWWAF